MTRFDPPVDATFDTGETRRLRSGRHVRLDNARMRGVPNSDRLLTILCSAGKVPSIFAVVAKINGQELLLIDEVLVISHADVQFPEFNNDYLCTCGARHPVDYDRVWEMVDHVRLLPAKRRVCDVGRVAGS